MLLLFVTWCFHVTWCFYVLWYHTFLCFILIEFSYFVIQFVCIDLEMEFCLNWSNAHCLPMKSGKGLQIFYLNFFILDIVTPLQKFVLFISRNTYLINHFNKTRFWFFFFFFCIWYQLMLIVGVIRSFNHHSTHSYLVIDIICIRLSFRESQHFYLIKI